MLHTSERICFWTNPRSGLDPQTRNHIWSYIQELNRDERVTVFFTTHYMEEADRVAERIAIIDHGRIVAQGSPSELKEQTGTGSLEDAFLKLTGSAIRDEQATNLDQMRNIARLWRKNR